MLQSSLFAAVSLTVSEITRYLRELLDSDEILRDVWVTGEVSNPAYPASGHLYFTLKDQNASLKCVMWKPQVMRLHFPVRAGMALEAHGAISVYEQGGQYQLYADTLRPAGEGALYQEFLRLKAQLESEGLFDPERKRPIPQAPAKIGIVTSPTGAALQDMLNTLRRRYPLAEVVVAPAAVQGEAAPVEIVNALTRLNSEPGVEVILLARGGGSLEDLWSFNDERVVRTVAASRVPVISGVGHETDFTLADFAADLRAPTPTAAAELAAPDKSELITQLAVVERRLQDLVISLLEDESGRLAEKQNQLQRISPVWLINNQQQRLDELTAREMLAGTGYLRLLRSEFKGLNQRFSSLNPAAVLKRGYAIVLDARGEIVRSINQVEPQAEIKVRVTDGKFNARVQSKTAGEE